MTSLKSQQRNIATTPVFEQASEEKNARKKQQHQYAMTIFKKSFERFSDTTSACVLGYN